MSSGIPESLTALSVAVDSLKPYGKNPRRGDVAAIARSLEVNGQYRPVVVNSRTNEVLAGNHTLKAAQQLGWTEIAATFVDASPEQAAKIVLVDNRSNDLAGYDDALLLEILEGLPELDGTGYDSAALDELMAGIDEPGSKPDTPTLAEKFLIPPMSVIDRRSGEWQERKRRWLSSGIRSEIGRGDNLLKWSDTILETMGTPKPSTTRARALHVDGEHFLARLLRGEIDGGMKLLAGGTSIFDPALCELAYRWFSAEGDHVLDPFAGGSVRGIVASVLGRRYTGIDLSAEQIAANEEQAHLGSDIAPIWHTGDSARMGEIIGDEQAFDFVLTCPPYGDLERYSDDPADISTMAHPEFLEVQAEIIAQTAARLRDDRFVVWVTSDIRDKRGAYRGLTADTIKAFEAAGMQLHNEVILVEPIGTAAVRAERPFRATRKLTRVHQVMLVFIKGDAKAAAQRLGDVSVAPLAEDDDLI